MERKEENKLKENNNYINNNVISNIGYTPFSETINQIVKSVTFDPSQFIIAPVIKDFGNQLKIGSSVILEQIKPMSEILLSVSEMMKPITSEILENIPKMSDYFEELAKTMEEARKNPDSYINWVNYIEKLNEYIWTMPYGMTSEDLYNILSVVNDEKEFDKQILKFFDKNKLNKLFDDIEKKLNRKHVVMFKQIKNSFCLGNYAIANVGILSIIDELCSYFLEDKGCLKRQNLFDPLIDEIEDLSDDIFEVIPLMIVNENINTIYEDIDFKKKIKIKTSKKVRRNPSQHGRSFSNRKIDTLMLLNTVFYLIVIIENYKQYKNRLIYVKNKKGLMLANTKYKQEVNKFYIKKKYVKKNQENSF